MCTCHAFENYLDCMFAWRFLSIGCLMDMIFECKVLLTVLMDQSIVKTI